MSRLSLSYLFLSSAAVLLVAAAEASAQSCTTAPSCAELGYTSAVADCVGPDKVYCPFDNTKVFCRQTKSCEELGYDKTTTQCSGKKTFVCPGDASKVSCDSGAMVGEIRLWAGSSIPKGWLKCEGQSLSSSTYKELYNAIGTAYGGNSKNFYLPNFKGRVPVGVGYATSSAYTYSRGSKGGVEKHTLTINEMPRHTHNYTIYSPGSKDRQRYSGKSNNDSDTDESRTTASAGGNSAHENRMPYLAVYYIIYTGVY